MHTYSEFNNYLGKKIDRPLANNTRVKREGDNITIYLHNSAILIYCSNGDIVYNSHGWRTQTTKERLNTYGAESWHVWQQGGRWFLSQYGRWDTSYLFADGLIVHPDNTLEGTGIDTSLEDKKLLKQIKQYCQDYMTELFNGSIPAPSGGDCWGCYLTSEGNDNPMGTDHLLSHLEEKYYVPSLLVKAIEKYHVSQAANWILGAYWGQDDPEVITSHVKAFGGIAREQLYKSLYRYMKSNILNVAV